MYASFELCGCLLHVAQRLLDARAQQKTKRAGEGGELRDRILGRLPSSNTKRVSCARVAARSFRLLKEERSKVIQDIQAYDIRNESSLGPLAL